MSALILLAVLIAVTLPLAWLAKRQARREIARWRVRQEIRAYTRAIQEMGRVIGESLVPAMQQFGQAVGRLGATFADFAAQFNSKSGAVGEPGTNE